MNVQLMKMKSILFLLLICPVCLLIGRAISTKTTGSNANSLTVNGRALNYDTFTLNSGGILAVVEGNLRITKDRAMPYQSLLMQGEVLSKQAPITHAEGASVRQSAELWPTTWLRGELGDAQSAERRPVPFRVTLQRNGTVLKQWPANAAETIESIQLNEIWPSARLGDELIVEPLSKSGAPLAGKSEKRVIKLKKVDPALLAGEGC